MVRTGLNTLIYDTDMKNPGVCLGGESTKGVETLLGNPKRAVLLMALPMMVGMVAQSANNLIDAVWVAGLGPDALAAVGFVFPLFFILIGIGNGVGVGASSAIARHIGRGDKPSADRTAMQSVVLLIIGGIIGMVSLLLFQRPMLEAMGAGDTIEYCVQYATPVFICTLIFLLNGLFSNLLRAEGASNRSMITQIIAAVINIILDPIFIYGDVFGEIFGMDVGFKLGLGMGMAGAAWATILAVITSFVIMLYWYFIKKDTYIKLRTRYIPLHRETDVDILKVGLPASGELVVISIISMVMNFIIVLSDEGTNGVAIYSSTWRLINILMIPLMSIGGAVVPVLGAAYGARRFDKMNVAYVYSIKFCLVLMVVLVLITEIFAEYMAIIFTYSDSTSALRGSMVDCLRITSLFLPFASWGFIAVGLFQAVGKGGSSFICTFIRNGTQLISSGILVVTVGTFISIMWGVVAMEILGSIIAGVWSYMLLRSISRGGMSSSSESSET